MPAESFAERPDPETVHNLAAVFADALNNRRPMVVDLATADGKVYTIEQHTMAGLTVKDYSEQLRTGRLAGDEIGKVVVEADGALILEYGTAGGTRTAPVVDIAQRREGAFLEPVSLEAMTYATMVQRMVMGTPRSEFGPSL